MIYLERLEIPNQDAETDVILAERRTCFNGVYPFRVFPQKQITQFDFAPITIFYGGNGSGKTTLLNVIAEKIGAIRHSEFNKSPFFERYINCCEVYGDEFLQTSQILSSDDVFDYVLNMRYLNEDIDNHRKQLFQGYATMRSRASVDPEYRKLHGLEDYDRWKETRDAFSKKNTQSKFVKERLARNIDMYSNGETAMRYFTEHIDRESVYLLDEPENSLSVQYQMDLAKYIGDSARFFDCQFVISTHSPMFLAIEGAKIYNLDTVPVQTCKWTELENVRKYFEFFEGHREAFSLTK